MRILLGLTFLLVFFFVTSCGGRPWLTDYEVVGPYEVQQRLPTNVDVHRKFAWTDYVKPDLVPVTMKVCRSPEGMYMRWDVLVTLQNQMGNLGLNVSEAPVDVYVDFDGDRPYGVDNATGEPITLEEYDEDLLLKPFVTF